MGNLDNYELRINKIINDFAYMFLQNSNIVAVGNGNKEVNGVNTNIPGLVFFVKKKVSTNLLNPLMIIPKRINGVITDVLEEGEGKAERTYYNKSYLKAFYKSMPALGGGCLSIDVSEDKMYISTLGYTVTERRTRESIYFLASAHFLDIKGGFRLGKQVNYSRGVNNDNEEIWLLGLMRKIVPIKYSNKFIPITYNLSDAGIGYVGVNNSKTKEFIYSGLMNGKFVKDIEKIKKGDVIYKVGVSTGYTEGIVKSLNAIAKFSDRSNREYYMKDQIVVEMRANEGDSGSLGINKKNDKAFGMLNGGDANYSYFSDIFNVFKELDIELLI